MVQYCPITHGQSNLHKMNCTVWTVQAMGLTPHSGSLCSFQRKWCQNDTIFFENCALLPAQTFNLTHYSNRLFSFIKENGFQKISQNLLLNTG